MPIPSHRHKWLGRQDSNLRNLGVKVQCLTAWLLPNINSVFPECQSVLDYTQLQNRNKLIATLHSYIAQRLVAHVGFEPTLNRFSYYSMLPQPNLKLVVVWTMSLPCLKGLGSRYIVSTHLGVKTPLSSAFPNIFAELAYIH